MFISVEFELVFIGNSLVFNRKDLYILVAMWKINY